MPANLITLAHFLLSEAISLANSPGELETAVLPMSAICALILGSAMIEMIAPLSLSMTAAGVFLRAQMPFHTSAS